MTVGHRRSKAQPRPARWVLWLDPGITTGWALLHLDTMTIRHEQYSFEKLVVMLDRWCLTSGTDTVLGCERFVITPDTHRRHGSVDAIQAWGAARSAAVRHHVKTFLDHQVSSAALTFTTDDILRYLGWYKTTMPHANDATRHLVRWGVKSGAVPDLERKIAAYVEQESRKEHRGKIRPFDETDHR